jgi:hypothetical protein
MKALRRSGGLAAFLIDRVDPESPRTVESLAQHRFRSIETAASEVTSVGWARPGDPSGGAVDPELLGDGMAWLQWRRDVKRLPGWKMQIELASAEKANWRPLSGRQRREAKQEIRDRLLPTWPVTTQLFDVLVRRDRVLLLAAGNSAVEQFGALWRDTFGHEPKALTPTALAGDDWENLRPTQFTPTLRQQEIHIDADFLGPEFLTRLWWQQESPGAGKTPRATEVLVEDNLRFDARDAEQVASAFRGTFASRDPGARAALHGGRLLDRARLSVASGYRCWQATLDAARLRLGAVKLPDDPEDAESAEDRTLARAGSWFGVHGDIERLFAAFLHTRRSPDWQQEADAIGAWMRT